MAKKKNSTPVESLTDFELLVMNSIWELENCIVAEVVDHLDENEDKKYAYTTIATIVKILEKKGYVKATKEGKAYRYSVAIAKEEYESSAVTDLVGKVFDGSVDRLVSHLLGPGKLNKKQLEKIKDAFNSRSKDD